MYYQLIFNGLTENVNTCLPAQVFQDLERAVRTSGCKVGIHPRGWALFEMLIYNAPSNYELTDLHDWIRSTLNSAKVDIICSNIEYGSPPIR